MESTNGDPHRSGATFKRGATPTHAAGFLESLFGFLESLFGFLESFFGFLESFFGFLESFHWAWPCVLCWRHALTWACAWARDMYMDMSMHMCMGMGMACVHGHGHGHVVL